MGDGNDEQNKDTNTMAAILSSPTPPTPSLSLIGNDDILEEPLELVDLRSPISFHIHIVNI